MRMHQGDDFLRAVVASPDDASFRAVYADWLEERGDVRDNLGHVELFCANQCRMAPFPTPTGRSPNTHCYAPKAMTDFHTATFRLLRTKPKVSSAAVSQVEDAERRLGFRLPISVREWYSNGDATDILARYSNQDPPIPLKEFAVTEWHSLHLLQFKYENQGVCTWSIVLDGSDDPPVYVDVDTDGAEWTPPAPTFSAYIHACVWDYVLVFDQPGLVQAQNEPLSAEALGQLRKRFEEQAPTFGWPGSTQHRFAGKGCAILIWAAEDQADWFVGAREVMSLETALRAVWQLDNVGRSLYDCSAIGKEILDRIRGGA